MNFSEMCNRAASLAMRHGADANMPQSDWKVSVNRAIARFSWEAEYNVSTYSTVTVLNQSEYTLPSPDWKYINSVIYNSTNSLILIDENQLERLSKTWTLDASGTPAYYFLPKPNTLRLYQAPNVAGITLSIRGVRAEAALVNLSDTSVAPEHYHEGIALMAAWFEMKNYTAIDKTGEIDISQQYYNEAMKLAAACRKYLNSQTGRVFQRYVNQQLPDRATIGWRTR